MELAVSFETSVACSNTTYVDHTYNQCARAVTCAQLLVRHLVAPPAPPPPHKHTHLPVACLMIGALMTRAIQLGRSPQQMQI